MTMSKSRSVQPLRIGGVDCAPGERTDLELAVTRLATGTWLSVPVTVLHGSRPGARVWVAAAIHGDELNGVEIVRRLMRVVPADALRGTVIAVPIVNVFGFLQQDRYLPDRRDLNRSFPGSARGSMAARLAHLFMTEIVAESDYGIDLHTGSNHRTNLPQLRVNASDPMVRRLSKAFRAPLTIDSKARDGSLRRVAEDRGCPVLVYEAGETLRFDRPAIQLGVRGVLRVLSGLKMIGGLDATEGKKDKPTRFVKSSQWSRAPRGGILLVEVELGQSVTVGQLLARVTDVFASEESKICASTAGVVIGLTTHPMVNRGDAVAHIAIL